MKAVAKRSKKITTIWTTRDGRDIRICDMEDSHLLRTIILSRKLAEKQTEQDLSYGYAMFGMLRGEMAQEAMDNELDRLSEDGYSPEEVNPLYPDLLLEAERRGFDVDKYERIKSIKPTLRRKKK